MRIALSFLFLIATIPEIALSQQASLYMDNERGSVNDSVYVNPSLGLTWELPKEWKVQETAPSLLGENYSVLLRLLPQPEELIEISRSQRADAVRPSLMQGMGWEPTGHTGYYSIGRGIPTHRNDYRSKSEPTRYLALLDGQHHGEVILIVTANSQERIEELVNTLKQIKVQPDWGTVTSSPVPVAPGSPPSRIRVSQSVSQGLLERKVQPVYPEAARKSRIQGPVVMLANISTEGKIESLFVLSGHPLSLKQH